MPDAEEAEEKIEENDFSLAVPIGSIFGWHIPCSLILNLGDEPYVVCDDIDADLESMYSVLKESEVFEEDFLEDIFYIHEVELETSYQRLGYEEILLRQLPAILVRTLHVFPSLLMYFPMPIRHTEADQDFGMMESISHRQNYVASLLLGAKEADNITYFPPLQEIPEREINYMLGRRNPGDEVSMSDRNQKLYRLYKSVGFREIKKTGWLYKRIASIYTEDGRNV